MSSIREPVEKARDEALGVLTCANLGAEGNRALRAIVNHCNEALRVLGVFEMGPRRIMGPVLIPDVCDDGMIVSQEGIRRSVKEFNAQIKKQ